MEEREHEQQTNEHDVLTVIRAPRSTIRASTVLSSTMFHGLSPLEFHGVIVICLGSCFEVREAHADVPLIDLL